MEKSKNDIQSWINWLKEQNNDITTRDSIINFLIQFTNLNYPEEVKEYDGFKIGDRVQWNQVYLDKDGKVVYEKQYGTIVEFSIPTNQIGVPQALIDEELGGRHYFIIGDFWEA